MAVLPLASTVREPATTASRRADWLRTLYRWHWLSSAACLVALLAFAATGLTLNHAGAIDARSQTVRQRDRLPGALLASLKRAHAAGRVELPDDVAGWIVDRLGIQSRDRAGDWTDQEVYVALPRPGGDASLTIDLGDGSVRTEATDRGWIAYFNDLHKGRNTGPAWSWFIDVFAVACLVFAGTGLCLLYLHGRARPSTWPMVGLGVVLPLVVALLFIH